MTPYKQNKMGFRWGGQWFFISHLEGLSGFTCGHQDAKDLFWKEKNHSLFSSVTFDGKKSNEE